MRTKMQGAIRMTLGLAVALVPVAADALPSADCEAAAAGAARAEGVPPAVLAAILRTESGRGPDAAPWPWAVNVDGTGYWPATRADALALAERALAGGAASVDIGCFQLNLHWHGEAFPSLDAMFAPEANAAYAAAFLARLERETGSWRAAAGAYHSRTPERAEAYRARLEAVHARTEGASPMPQAPTPAPPPHESPGLLATAHRLIDLGAMSGPLIAGAP